MIKKLLFSLILLITSICGSEAKNALVVIAHGSPIESWCKFVLNREDTVRNKMEAALMKECGVEIVCNPEGILLPSTDLVADWGVKRTKQWLYSVK